MFNHVSKNVSIDLAWIFWWSFSRLGFINPVPFTISRGTACAKKLTFFKMGQPTSPPWGRFVEPFWQQQFQRRSTDRIKVEESSFSDSSLRRTGRSRSKSRPRWKWAKPMGHCGHPARGHAVVIRDQEDRQFGKGNDPILRGLIKSYQPWSLTTCKLGWSSKILQVWSL